MKVEPTKDWSEKYTMDARIGTLDAQEVATCSRHILEVCDIDQNKHTSDVSTIGNTMSVVYI